MKNYFVKSKDRDGTCYHEFYKGKWKYCDYWHKDSICIDDDDMSERLVEIIRKYVPDYDYFGETEITFLQWQQIKHDALEVSDEAAEIVKQAEPWVEENFKEHKVFTLLGV